MSNIRKSITSKSCSLTFGHQQLVLVDLLLKEVDQVVFLLELLVELVDNVLKLNVEDFHHILIDAFSDIKELDMQGVFELFCPLVMRISQVIDFF
jgi:phage-related protein